MSFIGSTQVGKEVYRQASNRNKRVQSNAGAKNHCIIMPDYPVTSAVNAVLGASFGASGQRCMALSVAVVVGEAYSFIDLLVERARLLTIDSGINNPDLGPLTNSSQIGFIKTCIQESLQKGAKVSF